MEPQSTATAAGWCWRGFWSNKSGPQPNVVVLDTGLMLTDPSQAIVGQNTVANGAQPNGLAIATVATTVPPTAPTVTSASGPITNDVQNTIHVEGTNFASGAQVRIGGMRPLPATVNSSTDLQVTVPVNAPAAPGLDVIVTNPQSTSPPAQQQQSGLLAGGLTINANPAFQPHHEFASRNIVDGSISVFDFTQRAMVNVPLAPPAYNYSLTFNQAGTDLYAPSRGYRYYPGLPHWFWVFISPTIQLHPSLCRRRVARMATPHSSPAPTRQPEVRSSMSGRQQAAPETLWST